MATADEQRYVALLRAINLGARNRVPMARLREVCEQAGCTDVKTYIASGNVVLTSHLPRTALRQILEDGIGREFGISIIVVILTAAEIVAVMLRNPFPTADSNLLHVAFASDEIDARDIDRLTSLQLEPERVAIVGRQIYMFLPNGFATALMPKEVDRVKVKLTVRNWRTVSSVVALANG